MIISNVLQHCHDERCILENTSSLLMSPLAENSLSADTLKVLWQSVKNTINAWNGCLFTQLKERNLGYKPLFNFVSSTDTWEDATKHFVSSLFFKMSMCIVFFDIVEAISMPLHLRCFQHSERYTEFLAIHSHFREHRFLRTTSDVLNILKLASDDNSVCRRHRQPGWVKMGGTISLHCNYFLLLFIFGVNWTLDQKQGRRVQWSCFLSWVSCYINFKTLPKRDNMTFVPLEVSPLKNIKTKHVVWWGSRNMESWGLLNS